MSAVKILGVLLIVAGVAGLVYGSFSYTKETHEAKIGPLQFSIKEKETVAIPIWISVAAIAAGTILLVINRKR
jgi:TRAP-type C4-dicarboxylate transport system permease small subunit